MLLLCLLFRCVVFFILSILLCESTPIYNIPAKALSLCAQVLEGLSDKLRRAGVEEELR